MKVFLIAHQNYNYDNLCFKFDNFCLYEDESSNEFYNIFWELCYKFHLSDLPSSEDLIDHFTYLVSFNNEDTQSDNEEQDTPSSIINLEYATIDPVNKCANTLHHLSSEIVLNSFHILILIIH